MSDPIKFPKPYREPRRSELVVQSKSPSLADADWMLPEQFRTSEQGSAKPNPTLGVFDEYRHRRQREIRDNIDIELSGMYEDIASILRRTRRLKSYVRQLEQVLPKK